MMKKLISILLTLAMALSLCACGGPKYDESLMGVYTCFMSCWSSIMRA